MSLECQQLPEYTCRRHEPPLELPGGEDREGGEGANGQSNGSMENV